MKTSICLARSGDLHNKGGLGAKAEEIRAERRRRSAIMDSLARDRVAALVVLTRVGISQRALDQDVMISNRKALYSSHTERQAIH